MIEALMSTKKDKGLLILPTFPLIIKPWPNESSHGVPSLVLPRVKSHKRPIPVNHFFTISLHLSLNSFLC